MLSEALMQNLSVRGLCDDSRRVKEGDLFFSFPVADYEWMIPHADLRLSATIRLTCAWIVARVSRRRNGSRTLMQIRLPRPSARMRTWTVLSNWQHGGHD